MNNLLIQITICIIKMEKNMKSIFEIENRLNIQAEFEKCLQNFKLIIWQ